MIIVTNVSAQYAFASLLSVNTATISISPVTIYVMIIHNTFMMVNSLNSTKKDARFLLRLIILFILFHFLCLRRYNKSFWINYISLNNITLFLTFSNTSYNLYISKNQIIHFSFSNYHELLS